MKCLDCLHLKHLVGPGHAYGLLDRGIATSGLVVLLLLLAPISAEVTSCVGVTSETLCCFPRFSVARAKSNRFCSIAGVLSCSNCLFVRVAKQMASIKMKMGCIDTLSSIATRNPLTNLATYCDFVSMRSLRADIR